MMMFYVDLLASVFMICGLHFLCKAFANPKWTVEISQSNDRATASSFAAARHSNSPKFGGTRYVYVFAAVIGVGLIGFWVANGILNFLPTSVGSHDEDGFYTPTKFTLATFFGVLSAVLVPSLLLSNAKEKIKNQAEQ